MRARYRAGLGLLILTISAGCGGPQSVFSAGGADALQINRLFTVMLVGAVLLWLSLNGLFLYVTRRRPGRMSRKLAEAVIIGGGIVLPLVVLTSLLSWGLSIMPDQRAPGDGLRVRITGEEFWWRVDYYPPGSEEPVVSANELRMPAGRRTEIELLAGRVIHSFWVPGLGGKTDMIPGRTTRMSLEPVTPGIYRGQCAEFCGASHALMAMNAVVLEEAEFARWLEAEAAPARAPRGRGTSDLLPGRLRRLPRSPRHAGRGRRRPRSHPHRQPHDARRRDPADGAGGAGLLDRACGGLQARRADARLWPSVEGGTRGPGGLAGGARMRKVRDTDAPVPEGPFPPTEAMLAEPVPTEVAEAQADRLRRVWATPKGWRYWSAVNNTEVGVWYALTALAFMLCAGVLALLMRVQLAVPHNDFLSADRFNQFFTMHGSAMMFLFAVPMFEAISIILLPSLLGARDLPFPRLSAYGYWCFLIGGVFVLGSILFDAAPRSGWFMYPPLATQDEGLGSDIWLLGLSFIEVASIAAAVELIVGVLKCRPPGMRVNLMPLYAWYVLVVGGMILLPSRR